jgi:hypothetical protein
LIDYVIIFLAIPCGYGSLVINGELVFILDSRFHGNDINIIVVIPAEAGIHPMEK